MKLRIYFFLFRLHSFSGYWDLSSIWLNSQQHWKTLERNVFQNSINANGGTSFCIIVSLHRNSRSTSMAKLHDQHHDRLEKGAYVSRLSVFLHPHPEHSRIILWPQIYGEIDARQYFVSFGHSQFWRACNCRGVAIVRTHLTTMVNYFRIPWRLLASYLVGCVATYLISDHLIALWHCGRTGHNRYVNETT